MTGDHHGQTAKVATLLARALDGLLGTHAQVGWLVADLGDLAAEHCVLMPEDQ
jgi:hypothetical protein